MLGWVREALLSFQPSPDTPYVLVLEVLEAAPILMSAQLDKVAGQTFHL